MTDDCCGTGKPNGHYDLAVIGAGSAGFSAAITAAVFTVAASRIDRRQLFQLVQNEKLMDVPCMQDQIHIGFRQQIYPLAGKTEALGAQFDLVGRLFPADVNHGPP